MYYLLRKVLKDPERVCPRTLPQTPRISKIKKFLKNLKPWSWIVLLSCLAVIIAIPILLLNLINIHQEKPKIARLDREIRDIDILKCRNTELYGVWVAEDIFVYQDSLAFDIIVYNVTEKASQVLIKRNDYLPDDIVHALPVRIAPDLSYILICTESKNFMRTVKCKYNAVKTGWRKRKTPFFGGRTCTYVEFFSNKNNDLIVISDSIMYYLDSPVSKGKIVDPETAGIHRQGVPDILYEADITKRDNLVYMAPSGSWLMYISLHPMDEEWKDRYMTHYSLHGSKLEKYKFPMVTKYLNAKLKPYLLNINYQKAGTAVSKMDVKIWERKSLTTVSSIIIESVDLLQSGYFIFASFNEEKLTMTFTDRERRTSYFVQLKKSGSYEVLYIHNWPQSGWDEMYPEMLAGSDNDLMLILPMTVPRLTHVKGNKLNFLTPESTYVAQLLAWVDNGLAYILAAPEAAERKVYSVKWRTKREDDVNKSITPVLECISCPKKNESWPECAYARALPNPTKTLILIDCLGPDIPRTWIWEAKTSSRIVFLDNRPMIQEIMAGISVPRYEYLKIPLLSGFRADAKLTLPGRFQNEYSSLNPFPIIFYMDPIPGEQLVDKRWRLDWHEYAATNWNIVVVQVDARGAGYHSMNRIYSVKGRIPEIMVNDQISAIRYIAKKKKYLDIGKLLLVGEGLGGTIALIAASKFAPFISGVAVYNARLNLHNSSKPATKVTTQKLSVNMYPAIGFTEKFIIPPKSENLSDLAASWNNTYTYISHCLNNQVCPCEEFYRLLYSFDPALNIHTMVYPEEWTPDYMGSSRKHFYFIMVKQACDKTVCHRQLSGQNASTDPEEEEEF